MYSYVWILCSERRKIRNLRENGGGGRDVPANVDDSRETKRRRPTKIGSRGLVNPPLLRFAHLSTRVASCDSRGCVVHARLRIRFSSLLLVLSFFFFFFNSLLSSRYEWTRHVSRRCVYTFTRHAEDLFAGYSFCSNFANDGNDARAGYFYLRSARVRARTNTRRNRETRVGNTTGDTKRKCSYIYIYYIYAYSDTRYTGD